VISTVSIHGFRLQARGHTGINMLRAMYRDGFTYGEAIRAARELQNVTEQERAEMRAAMGPTP
jgi:hypothetical protein